MRLPSHAQIYVKARYDVDFPRNLVLVFLHEATYYVALPFPACDSHRLALSLLNSFRKTRTKASLTDKILLDPPRPQLLLKKRTENGGKTH